jgi:hypothetical protein
MRQKGHRTSDCTRQSIDLQHDLTTTDRDVNLHAAGDGAASRFHRHREHRVQRVSLDGRIELLKIGEKKVATLGGKLSFVTDLSS